LYTIDFFQSGGKVRRPLDVPVDIFADEIKFFQLGTAAMATYQENEGYIFEGEHLMISFLCFSIREMGAQRNSLRGPTVEGSKV